MHKKIYELAKKLINKGTEDHIPAYAAQTAFFIVLSFFPFATLLLIALAQFPVARSSIINMIVGIMPKELDNYVRIIISDIFLNKSSAITILTVIVALWSAAKGIQAMTLGLNQIYRVDRKKNFFIIRIFSAFYTLILMLILVIGMVLFVFGKNLVLQGIDKLPSKQHIWTMLYGLRHFVSIIILFLFLLLVYFQLPNRKGRLKNEIVGAFLASIGWVSMTKTFSFYITNSVDSSYMYGSLTSILLIVLWMYFTMQILFWGAEINYFMARYYDRVLEIKKEIKSKINKMKE